MTYSSWKDYMYLVAIPSGDLFVEALRIQKLLSNSWENYKNSPPIIHITICTVKEVHKEQIEMFNRCVQQALDGFETLQIQSNSFECFTTPHKSLVLKIEDNQTLQQIQYSLREALDKYGFFVPPFVDKWIFHITILSEIFAKAPLDDNEFVKVCQRVALQDTPIRGAIKRFELWRPVMEEKERVVERYYLN